MFDAEIIRSTQADGAPRIDLNLGGQKVFIALAQADKTNAAPKAPYFGLEHIGLTVTDIDGITAELKGKGADFTMEPNTCTPGRAHCVSARAGRRAGGADPARLRHPEQRPALRVKRRMLAVM